MYQTGIIIKMTIYSKIFFDFISTRQDSCNGGTKFLGIEVLRRRQEAWEKEEEEEEEKEKKEEKEEEEEEEEG